MGYWDRVMAAVSCIFLEPPVFLFYISYGIFFVTSQQLYIEKACKVNFGFSEEVCDNIKDHNSTQVEVQKLVSTIQGLNGSLQSLPTILVALCAGPLADRFSRKPLILASLAGYVLLNIIYMANAYWFYELKVEYLLFECLQDLTGGDLVFLMGVNLLIVDTSTVEDRTRKIIMVDAFRYAGRSVGVQLGAIIRSSYGWGPIFILNMCLLVATFLYIFFLVKEKRRPPATSGATGCWQMSRSLLQSYKQLLGPRESVHRASILAIILALAVFYFQANGQGPLWYLFMRLQYGMDMEKYADLAVSWSCRSILTNLVLLPLLMKRFQDTTLILLSITTTALAFSLTTLGSTFLYMLLVGMLFLFYWPIEKISMALLSKLVEEHEVGTAFSFLAVLSKCIDLVAKPSYGFLYRATVAVFPASYLFVSTGFLGLVFIIVLYVHVTIGKQSKQQEEQVKNSQ